MEPIELQLGFDLEKLRTDSKVAGKVIQDGVAGEAATSSSTAKNADPLLRMSASAEALRRELLGVGKLLDDNEKRYGNTLKLLERQRDAAKELFAFTKGESGGVGGGGSGSGAGGGAGAAGGKRESSMLSHARGMQLVHALQQVEQMAMHGFSESSILRGVGSMLSTLGPAGMLGGMIFNTAAAGRELEVSEGRTRLEMYRRGGNLARQTYHDLTSGAMAGSEFTGWQKGSPQELGLTNPEMARVVQSLMHAQGNLSNVWDVTKLQAGYGAGDEATRFLGALSSQGQQGSRREIAQVIGLYLAQGLDRGHFGQSFDFMTRAVASAVTGVINVSELARTAQFIGSAGDRFKGDTASAHTMLSALEGMAGGRTGAASKYFALRAAGLGSGANYWQASLAVSRGLNMTGGVTTRQTIGAYLREAPDIESAWRAGNRAYAANRLAMLSGQTPAMAEDMLQAYFAGGGAEDVTAGREGKINAAIDQARVPEADRKHADDENRKQWLLNREAYYRSRSQGTRQSRGSDYLESEHDIKSIEQFESLYGRSNYGQSRTNVIESGEYKPGQRTHDAQDMYFPPGSPVYVAVAGVVTNIGQAMKDSRYGWYVEVTDDQGRAYRYVHLAEKPSCATGDRLAAGTLLGHTMKNTFPGGDKSHLHMSVRDRAGRALNPYSAMGVKGLNTLVSGLKKASEEPATSNNNTTESGVSYDDMPGGVAPEDYTGPPISALGRGRNNVTFDVHIHDHRVSVTQRASRESSGNGVALARQGLG